MTNDLPPGWTQTRLGDLGVEIRGQLTPEPAAIYDLYSVPTFPTGRPERIEGTQAKSGKRVVQPDDVLLCKINPRINRVWVVGQAEGVPQISSTEYLVLRPHEPRMSNFIQQYLSSPRFRDWIKLSVEGATGSHARAKSGPILQQPIPVAPLAEQERIVAAIEEHLTRLDAVDASIDVCGGRCQALIRSVIVGSIPMELPEDWKLRTVAEAGDTGLGRQRSPKYHSGTNMKPYLRVANVFEDRIDTSSIMEMHFEDADFEKYRLRAGDILLNEGQSPELLGRPAMYRGEPPEVAFTNSLIRFVPGPGVMPEWALLVFRRHMHARRFMRESRITTNIAHLALGRFRTVEFPIPPLDTQHELVASTRAALNSIDKMIVQIRSARANADRIRRAVLTAAFSGRLVAQDPNDEPAPLLLERIAASRRAKPMPQNVGA